MEEEQLPSSPQSHTKTQLSSCAYISLEKMRDGLLAEITCLTENTCYLHLGIAQPGHPIVKSTSQPTSTILENFHF
jgi:hypothetical protein